MSVETGLGVPLTPPTSHVHEIEANMGIDVEITVYMSFSEESEELLRIARKASDRLKKEYRLMTVVVPRLSSWCITEFCNTTSLGLEDDTKVYVNGHPVPMDKGQLEENIVHVALATLNAKKNSGLPVYSLSQQDEIYSLSVVS